MTTPRPLHESVIAVIGSSGVLGALVAQELSRRGAHLIQVNRSGTPTPELNTLACVAGDLRDAGLGHAIAEVAEQAGRLDGVINVAGVVVFGPLTDMDDAMIEELFLINTIGPLWMVRSLIPMLSVNQGFLANVSAIVAEKPLPNMAVYSATKAALSAADHALNPELRRARITVHDIRPPHTETGLANRPMAGTAPKLPPGKNPDTIAQRIVEGIRTGITDMGSAYFA